MAIPPPPPRCTTRFSATNLDNGDGLELTRGAAFNLVADNVFRSTDANPEPSQGIEILLGNDNTVVSNRFEGYSDGLQINWGYRNYIAANIFTNNTFGLSLSGAGNIIDGNVIYGNTVGIAARHDDGTDFPQCHLRQRPKDRALLRRRQLRPRHPRGRHRVRPAERGARKLCRQARHWSRSGAGKPRQDLPGWRAQLPSAAEWRSRRPHARARAQARGRAHRARSTAGQA